jgi:prepilin-type N-terminal cleavage/methylation domain-containing protein
MARSTHGFTLIEMMIVVAIIGVLAVVAGTAYRRYMDSARTTEAYGMLGEIRQREEAYKAEFSQYTGWATDELTTSAWPQVDLSTNCVGSSREPCYKTWQTAQTPPQWTALGINPGKQAVQCGYLALSGSAGQGAPATIGQDLFNNAAPQTMWWYAVAVCDNDGTPGTNATFATAFNTTVVSTQNEHK